MPRRRRAGTAGDDPKPTLGQGVLEKRVGWETAANHCCRTRSSPAELRLLTGPGCPNRRLARSHAQPKFVGLWVGVVPIMSGLTYFPALSLGPVAEQVAMNCGIHYPAP